MSYLQTRFHPDASVTSGSAYRELKNVHRFTPFRSPYPIIDDIVQISELNQSPEKKIKQWCDLASMNGK
jgi:hypothetical protein